MQAGSIAYRLLGSGSFSLKEAWVHIVCRSLSGAEGHEGETSAAEGDAGARLGPAAPPPAASSMVEVFLGGLAPNASEGGLRAALGASGLPPTLFWVRLQMKESHEEAGPKGAVCNGAAYLGFASRPAAVQACQSVRQVDGRPVALHIARGRSAEQLPCPAGGTLPEDSCRVPDSHITRLLRAVRACRRAGPSSAAAAVQAAMSAAFGGAAADCRGGLPMGKRGVGRLSSSPLRGGARSDFVPSASGPPLAKRQAVGEPGASSTLQLPGSDNDLGPAYSSSAASVQPFMVAGTLGRGGERGMGMVAEVAGEGEGAGTRPAFGGDPESRPGMARDRSESPCTAVTPRSASAAAARGLQGGNEAGRGSSVERGGSCSRSLPGGATSSAGEGGSMAQSLAELLEHYPETRQALESYRGNKLGAQLQSLTPLTILNQHANRMKVEVSFMERAETPTGPFTVQAKICVPGPSPAPCILGSGKARIKKDAKQIAASVVLEQLLPLLRNHAAAAAAAAANDRQQHSGGAGGSGAAPSAAGRGKKSKGVTGTADSSAAYKAERSSRSSEAQTEAPHASHKSDDASGRPPPFGAVSSGSTGIKAGGGQGGGGSSSYRADAAAAASRCRDPTQKPRGRQEQATHQRFSEGQVQLDEGQLQQQLQHQRLDDYGQMLSQPRPFGPLFGVGVWPAGSQGVLMPPHWTDSSLPGIPRPADPSFPADLALGTSSSRRAADAYQIPPMVQEGMPAFRGTGTASGGPAFRGSGAAASAGGRGGSSGRFPEPLGIRGAVGKAQGRERHRLEGGSGVGGMDSPHLGPPLLGNLFSHQRGQSRSEDGGADCSGERQDPWAVSSQSSQKRRHNDVPSLPIWGGGGYFPPQRQGAPLPAEAVPSAASAGLLLPPDELMRLEAQLAQQNISSLQQQQGLQGMLLGLQQMQGGNMPSIWQPPPLQQQRRQQESVIHPRLSSLDLSDPVVDSPRSAFGGAAGGWPQHQSSGTELGRGNAGMSLPAIDLSATLWHQQQQQGLPPSHHPPEPPALPPQQKQISVQEVLADVQRLMQGAGIRGGEASSGADLAWIAAGLLDDSAEG